MALVKVSFDIAGDKQYERAFQSMAEDVSDLSAPLGEIAHIIRQQVGDQFQTEGVAGDGTPWAPLSPVYALWKEAHYPGMPILVRTTAMRAAALNPAAFTIEKHRLTYEIDSDYAIYHQRGTYKMPQRRIVALTEEVKRKIDRQFAEWINYLRHKPFGTG